VRVKSIQRAGELPAIFADQVGLVGREPEHLHHRLAGAFAPFAAAAADDFEQRLERRPVVSVGDEALRVGEADFEIVGVRIDASVQGRGVGQALASVVAATDIVLVPIATSKMQFGDITAGSGLRQGLVRASHSLLRFGQLKADTPRAVNGMLFGTFCHAVCSLVEMSWSRNDRAAWMVQNRAMAENILDAVRRDPGRRVLVAMRCQRTHVIEPLLRRHPELLELVEYWEV